MKTKKHSVSNPFLAKIMQELRVGRLTASTSHAFYNRTEKCKAGTYIETWFKTDGCRWDAIGGCTMCNYGHGSPTSSDEMVESVRRGLAAINVPVDELVVSPSGSMLDQREVPIDARRQIFSLVSEFPAKTYIFETRPETVTENAIRDLVEIVSNKRLGIELGLESSNPWIQQYCINKGSYPDQFIKAAGIISKFDIDVLANVSIGTAFLPPREAIINAIDSAKWALENGANIVVLFPLHVKPNTLLAWLYTNNLYQPPSLWSLVDVLKQLGPEKTEFTDISWYRNYYSDESKILASPKTCEICQNDVLELLDIYRMSRSFVVVEKLDKMACNCKDEWKKQINDYSQWDTLPAKIWGIYELLGKQLLNEIENKKLLNNNFQNRFFSSYNSLK